MAEGGGAVARTGRVDVDADALSRDERQEIGMLCKRVIDHGRLQWLRQQGFATEMVCFVDGAVSGENKLLLGSR